MTKNRTLWIVQGLLAAIFLFAGVMKLAYGRRRLITDFGTEFDGVPEGHKGKLYLEIVPRTRHMLFWERPEVCWPRVKRFLAAHAATD